MLPVKQLLIVHMAHKILAAKLLSERLGLGYHAEEPQTVWIADKLRILWFRPIAHVVQVGNEVFVLEKAILRQKVQIVRIGETLNQFQLLLEARRRAGHLLPAIHILVPGRPGLLKRTGLGYYYTCTSMYW